MIDSFRGMSHQRSWRTFRAWELWALATASFFSTSHILAVRQENCGSQEFSKDGTEARCHCYIAHGRAVPQHVHTGVLRCSPSEVFTTGRMHQGVRA